MIRDRASALRLIGATLLLLLTTAALPPAADALLTYTLSSELKKTSCSGDTDADCLDNTQETNLAWAVSPWYFYDEDEDCSGWTNKWGLPASHFARQDFFQVRPQGTGVRNWSPTSGTAKWIRITYFLNFPHDCGGWDGHQGDSEHVRFHLYSYDLKTWYLSYAYYAHHGYFDYISGSFFATTAGQLGTAWASVAADEDSHGSWPGKEVGSSHCAGSMDDFCLSFCDCFINTWQSDFNNYYFEYPSASRNVGGPTPESWNSSVVTVSGGTAYSLMDVGHGLNREYWTPRTDKYKLFCGWECTDANRKSDGNCYATIHTEDDCAGGPLSSKVDTVSFNLDGVLGGGGDPEWLTTGPVATAEEDLFPLAGPLISDEERLLRRARLDPVASRLPRLVDMAPREQLETLTWMLTVPDDRRLVGLFPDLVAIWELDPAAAAWEARGRLGELVDLLAAQGHPRRVLPSGFSPARIDPAAPPPNDFPPGLIEEILTLTPDDPDKEEFLTFALQTIAAH